MRKLLLITFSVFMMQSLLAQKVTVSEMSQKVNKINRTGMGMLLDINSKDVENAFKKKLKDYGKVDKEGDYMIVHPAQVSSVSSKPVKITAKVQSQGKQTLVWWAIDLGDKYVTSGGTGYKAAEKILHDFGIEMYLEDINEQIKDAEDALEKVVKQQDKTIKEGENLQDDLKDNAKEKEDLESALKKNAQDKIDIQEDIQQNKKDQEAMTKEVSEAKKAVEIVKAKLQKVE